MGTRRIIEGMEILERVNAQAEARIQAETGEPSIYEQMWRLLDKRMDVLMSIPGPLVGDKMLEMKAEAKAIAECLAIIGSPLVSDVDDVRAEAVKRWEQRDARHKYPVKTTMRKPARKRA